jgi:hypothetical protein
MGRALRECGLWILLKLAVLAWLPSAALVWAELAQAQENPTEIVAAAVRQRGHVCDSPESAVPDHQNTTPDEKAWIIRCKSGSYRVKFKGDTGAEVEPVDD